MFGFFALYGFVQFIILLGDAYGLILFSHVLELSHGSSEL